MSALDKVIALAGQSAAPAALGGDPAAELVMAALSGLAELQVLLAKPSDKEDDEDDSDGGSTDQKGGGDSHSGHPLFKKLKGKGVDPKRAASMCSQADKRVKAAALLEAATIALSGLTASDSNWVEATAGESQALALASGKKPYGSVAYADPGLQRDGKVRFPTDNPENTRLSWSYVNQDEHARKYRPEDLDQIKAKLKLAMKKHGIKGGDAASRVEASYVVELAGKPPFGKAKAGKGKPVGPPQQMHHGSFTGAHSHGHTTQVVHEHEHFHNNDSSHDFHAHGGEDSDGNNFSGQGYAARRDW